VVVGVNVGLNVGSGTFLLAFQMVVMVVVVVVVVVVIVVVVMDDGKVRRNGPGVAMNADTDVDSGSGDSGDTETSVFDNKRTRKCAVCPLARECELLASMVRPEAEYMGQIQTCTPLCTEP